MSTPLTDATLKKIKATLEDLKSRAQDSLDRIEDEDPFLAGDRSRIEEPGTVAMEEDGHRRVEAQKIESENMLKQIDKALIKLEEGSYGICERCGKSIEEKRLEAMPMATLCLACETKKTKR